MLNKELLACSKKEVPTSIEKIRISGYGTVAYYVPSGAFAEADPRKVYLTDIVLMQKPKEDTTVQIFDFCDMTAATDLADFSVYNDVIAFSNLHSFAYGDAIPIITKVTIEVDGVSVDLASSPYESMLYGTGDTYIQERFRGGAFIGVQAVDYVTHELCQHLKNKLDQTVSFEIILHLETDVARKIYTLNIYNNENIDKTQRFIAQLWDRDGNVLYPGGRYIHFLDDANGKFVLVGKRGDLGQFQIRSYDGKFNTLKQQVYFGADGETETIYNHVVTGQLYHRAKSDKSATITVYRDGQSIYYIRYDNDREVYLAVGDEFVISPLEVAMHGSSGITLEFLGTESGGNDRYRVSSLRAGFSFGLYV